MVIFSVYLPKNSILIHSLLGAIVDVKISITGITIKSE